jgi:hypothetical protein
LSTHEDSVLHMPCKSVREASSPAGLPGAAAAAVAAQQTIIAKRKIHFGAVRKVVGMMVIGTRGMKTSKKILASSGDSARREIAYIKPIQYWRVFYSCMPSKKPTAPNRCFRLNPPERNE